MAATATSLYAASTSQSADSIEAHPTYAGLFALGTYQIQQHEEEQKRTENNEDDEPNGTTGPPISRKGTVRLMQSHTLDDGRIRCDTLETIDTAAVLDMKWLCDDDSSSSILSVARADATLSLYRLAYDAGRRRLTDATHTRINDTGALCLSLDWSRTPSTSAASCIVSQSDGTLAFVSSLDAVRSGDVKRGISTWKAHDYEAWIAAFDRYSNDGRVVWSGGDDLTLKGWDVRTPLYGGSDNDDDDDEDGNASAALRQPTFTHKRSFEGGVTAIQSHPLVQHLWAVGSYDAQLRLFDARNTARPVAQTDVGGGVWRVKWHPTKPNTLLVGCMHDGFKVLNVDGGIINGTTSDLEPPPSITLRTRFDEHGSLAYGCDWDRGAATVNAAHADYVYSCSFYDAMLHAWSSD